MIDKLSLVNNTDLIVESIHDLQSQVNIFHLRTNNLGITIYSLDKLAFADGIDLIARLILRKRIKCTAHIFHVGIFHGGHFTGAYFPEDYFPWERRGVFWVGFVFRGKFRGGGGYFPQLCIFRRGLFPWRYLPVGYFPWEGVIS